MQHSRIDGARAPQVLPMRRRTRGWQAIISVQKLTQDLRVGLPGAQARRPRRSAAARSSRCSAPTAPARPRSSASSAASSTPSSGTVLADGHDIVRDAARPRVADRPGAAGAVDRRVRDRLGDGALQPRPVRQAAGSRRTSRRCCAQLSLWDKRDTQDHDAVGRHEAARADRQGAVARADDPVPRRAHRRRRRRAAPRHVADGARAARAAASPSS